jgi:predicted nuclease of predicted toxin-antitoxin system
MNLSPGWIRVLERHGHEAVHWSAVGDIRAHDDEIMAWARERGHVVFTHDLDFGSTLAVTQARSPSVLPRAAARKKLQINLEL